MKYVLFYKLAVFDYFEPVVSIYLFSFFDKLRLFIHKICVGIFRWSPQIKLQDFSLAFLLVMWMSISRVFFFRYLEYTLNLVFTTF